MTKPPKDPKEGDLPEAVNSATVLISSGSLRPSFPLYPAEEATLQVEVIGGPMDGLRVAVREGPLTLGRGEDNSLSLALDLLVSTEHARILRQNGRFFIEDLGSRNGTFVGRERVRLRAPIEPGAIFTLGSTCFEFMPQ